MIQFVRPNRIRLRVPSYDHMPWERVGVHRPDQLGRNGIEDVRASRVDQDIGVHPRDLLVSSHARVRQDQAFLPRRASRARSRAVVKGCVEDDEIEAVVACVGFPALMTEPLEIRDESVADR